MVVGQTFCLVGQDGKMYVRHQAHELAKPEAVALLAATTWMLHRAVKAYSTDPDAYARWISLASEAWNPVMFNERYNPGGVHDLVPAQLAEGGVAVQGRFLLLPSSNLTAEWALTGEFEDAGDEVRVLGALTMAADGAGMVVPYAWAVSSLRAMVSEGQVDLRDPDLSSYLPQKLTDDSARLAQEHRRLPG